MRTYTPKKSRLQVESLEDRVALSGGFATLSSLPPAVEVRSAQGGGTVLPATARPYGYSLTDMSQKTAPFNTSGNDPRYYPKTPFQVLYVDPSTFNATPTPDGGLAVTASNSFKVSPGTPFYVPLLTADDAGTGELVDKFPKHASGAADFVFGPDLFGVKNTEIIVDGKSTPVGAAYVVGPVHMPQPLPDTGTNIITLGVFLSPMSVGTHRVDIKGEVAGLAFQHDSGLTSESFDFTYTVQVG